MKAELSMTDPYCGEVCSCLDNPALLYRAVAEPQLKYQPRGRL